MAIYKGDKCIAGAGYTPTVQIAEDTKEWVINGERTGFSSVGLKGDTGEKGDTGRTGEKGDTGNGIASITQVSEDTVNKTITYDINMTDGSKHSFTVQQGIDGRDGIDGKDGVVSFDELTDAQKAEITESLKSTKIDVTLVSSEWVSNSDGTLHRYIIEDERLNVNSVIEVTLLAPDLSYVQACANAQILYIFHSNNQLCLYAYGSKPTGDIPIVLIIRNDVTTTTSTVINSLPTRTGNIDYNNIENKPNISSDNVVTAYSSQNGQVRNIFLSSAEPTVSDGADGDIWIVYEE